jgi:hypothetical protein
MPNEIDLSGLRMRTLQQDPTAMADINELNSSWGDSPDLAGLRVRAVEDASQKSPLDEWAGFNAEHFREGGPQSDTPYPRYTDPKGTLQTRTIFSK